MNCKRLFLTFFTIFLVIIVYSQEYKVIKVIGNVKQANGSSLQFGSIIKGTPMLTYGSKNDGLKAIGSDGRIYIFKASATANTKDKTGFFTALLSMFIRTEKNGYLSSKDLGLPYRHLSIDTLVQEITQDHFSIYNNEELVLSILKTDPALKETENIICIFTDSLGKKITTTAAASQSAEVKYFSFNFESSLANIANPNKIWQIDFLLYKGEKSILRKISTTGYILDSTNLNERLNYFFNENKGNDFCNKDSNYLTCKKKYLIECLSGAFGFLNEHFLNDIVTKYIINHENE